MIERLMLRAADAAVSGGDPYAAVNPELIVGPILLGLVLNVWLYGMQLMQVEIYFRSNPRDPTWIKALVLFLLFVDTLNTVFDVWFTYDYSVKKFGDKAAILQATWVFNTDPVMTVIVSSTVQGFFAWRVRKLTGMTWLAVIIALLAVAQFFCGLGTGIACGIVKEFTKFHSFKSIVIAWLVLAPIADITISVALVQFLQKSKTGFAVTDDIVGKITRLTIQTGAITAVWAVVDLVLFLCWANNLHLIFNMPLSKLYSNCLMSSLNARRQWGGSSYTSADPTAKRETRGGIGIHVTTTTGVTQDAYEMDPRSQPFDGTAKIGATHSRDIKRKTIDDGLSLNESVGGSDIGADDAFDDMKKLADEEAPKQFPLPPAETRVQVQQAQAELPTDNRVPNHRHPYVNIMTPTAVPRAGWAK